MIDPQELVMDSIHEVRALVGEYSFYFDGGGLPQVRIKVWLTDVEYGGDRYTYSTSHYIHTPTQASKYTPSAPFAASERLAVEKAIRDFLTFYSGAISRGHQPSEEWLVVNERF